MTGERPAFWDYLVGEPDSWRLKEGSPPKIVRELEERI
jgi:hypothetical protein